MDMMLGDRKGQCVLEQIIKSFILSPFHILQIPSY